MLVTTLKINRTSLFNFKGSIKNKTMKFNTKNEKVIKIFFYFYTDSANKYIIKIFIYK